MIWGIYSALQGTGMPFPAPHRRKKQTVVNMVCTSLQVQHLAWHTPEFMQNGSGRRPLPFVLFFY